MDLLMGINKQEVLKYLGYRGGLLEKEYDEKIDEIAKKVLEVSEPKICSVRLKIASHNPLRFENTNIVFAGEDIKKHLESSHECVFMAATLGFEIDRLIKRIMITDMAEAVIYDACASSAIENLCDSYTKKLEKEFSEEKMYITERFSPGYGDLPIECQKDFCGIVESAKKIGLHYNRAMMLEPTKSVTALIGISHAKQIKRQSGCENCALFYDCNFRKRGATCYEQIEG